MIAARPRRGFARRLAVAMIAVAVLPTIALGWALIDLDQDTLRDRSRELLFAISDDVAHTAAATLDDARTGLDAVARVLADVDQPIDARLAAARAIVEASSLTAVELYDGDGARIDAIREPDAAWHGPPTLAAPLRELALADGLAIAEVEAAEGEPFAPLVVPVRGTDATWFAVAGVSLEPLAARLAAIASDRFGDDLDAVVVVDRQLRTVAHVDPERAATGAPVTTELLDGVELALARGLLYYRSFDGPDGAMVGVVRSLPDLPWVVIVQMPSARVFAPVTRMRQLVIGAIAAASLAAAAAALWLARRTAAPIGRLVELARDLGQRRFERTVEVHTGDELETLGEALSTAAHDLAASEQRIRDELAIRHDLGRYLPAQLVDQVVRRAQRVGLGGDRRTLTVLFADVASFTPLVERHPPDQVVIVLNQLFTLLTEIVFRHGGTVDKLIGDCIMAFWGAPDAQPDQAARAIAAAVDMQRWVEAANPTWEAELGVTIHLAIGVHTGEAIVGNFGSETRMEYTCIGDTVNVAARLETLARPQQILISEATRAAAGEGPTCLALGTHQLPGRLEPVMLHEVLV